jgi:hypothetical protein
MALPRLNLGLLAAKPKNGIITRYISLMDMYTNSSNQHVLQDILEEGCEIKDALYRVLPEGSQVTGYPSCPCGELKYGISQGVDGNTKCKKCLQGVQELGGGSIETLFWLGTPDGINRFINPKLLIDLLGIKGLDKNSFNPWRFLMDSSYKPKSARAKKDPLFTLLDNAVSDGLVRGYNHFCDNLRENIKMVYELKIAHTNKSDQRVNLIKQFTHVKALLKLPDDKLFSVYLPILNSTLLQIERIGNSIFKSDTTDVYGRAITTVALLPRGVGAPITSKSEKTVSKEMSDMYMRLTEAYLSLMMSEGQKPGTIKMDILGSRSDMTFRGVIVPIFEEHEPDECHIPWSFGITLLTPLLIEKLLRVGLTENEAINHLADHTVQYDAGLDMMMREIVRDYCRGFDPGVKKGIPISLIRYPSLEVHSNLLLTVTKIKTNPRDFSLAISPHTLPSYRGDHDGDELQGQVIQDRRVLKAYYNNHMTKNTIDLSTPYHFGRPVKLPDPVVQAFVGYCTIYRNE